MEFLTKNADGSCTIREYMGRAVISNEVANTLHGLASEAKKDDKKKEKIVVQIAGIHEGVTRNYTEYPWEELKESIPTWTTPYNRPLIVNHNDYDVDKAIGRILKVSETKHDEKNALLFTASVADIDAVEKVADGRYFSVSIGTKVKSAECSICGNDWVSGEWCEHRRGKYYAIDEDDPKSEIKQCTWIIGGIEGLELSYVSVPADEHAHTISLSENLGDTTEELKIELNSLDELCLKLYLIGDEGSVDVVLETGSVKNIANLKEAQELFKEIEKTTSIPEEDTVTQKGEEVEENSAMEEKELEKTLEESAEDLEAELTDAEDEETDETADLDVESDDSEEEEDVEDEPAEDLDLEADEETDSEEVDTETADEESDDESDETDELETVTAELEDLRVAYASMESELSETRIQLLLSLRGVADFESEETVEAIDSYRGVETSVIRDLIRGELAQRRADLASIANSVVNPALTTQASDDEPHNPSDKKTRKYKIPGINKELEVARGNTDNAPKRKFKVRKVSK